MSPLGFIISPPQASSDQNSNEVLTSQGSSSKTTDGFSPSTVNAAVGNTLVHDVQNMANKNLVAHALRII